MLLLKLFSRKPAVVVGSRRMKRNIDINSPCRHLLVVVLTCAAAAAAAAGRPSLDFHGSQALRPRAFIFLLFSVGAAAAQEDFILAKFGHM
ncbi:unnamed protein product [Sphagnum troendelagicum]|uniref:Uncharacterized protein n=1 Tax=Sphagnum troendelagicum TaxID=128251 RepID=A0ABP0V386_9BRYO